MKTLQWITIGLLSASLLASCNMDGDQTHTPAITDAEPDGEIKPMDNSDGIFLNYDKNQDDGITQEEFDEAFDGEVFADWDKNSDELLDFDEFRDGVFDMHDKDRDSKLSENERNTLFDDKPGADLADWDRDGNKEMDREEFRQIFSMKTEFTDYDENANGKLEKNEYTKRMYRRMDDNNDGIISRSEFNDTDMN